MKKILSSLLALALILSSMFVITTSQVSAAAVIPGNLIVNGDFETADVPSLLPSPFGANPGWYAVSDYQKWFRTTPGTGTNVSTIITDPSDGGNKILKATQSAACGVTVVPGKTYVLTFSAKADYDFDQFRMTFFNVNGANTNATYEVLYPIVAASGTKTYMNGNTPVVENISPSWRGVDHCLQVKLPTDKWATYKISLRIDPAWAPSSLGALVFMPYYNYMKVNESDANEKGDPVITANHLEKPFYLDNVSLQESFSIISNVENLGGKTGGTIQTPGTIKAVTGENVTLKAVPNSGSTFLGWYLNDTLASANAEYSFAATGNATYLAKFSNPVTVYTPPTTITPDDIVSSDPNLMISYPHYGTPAFTQPGGQLKAEVRAPASYGTTGWTAWVENDYQKWDCTVGNVTYGASNIYLGLKAGYVVPVTLPYDVSPELCTLVLNHKSGLTLRSPMSVSVVQNLDSSFYTMSLTDTHMGWNAEDSADDNGTGAPSAWGLMCQALKVTGIRFLSHTGDVELYPNLSRAEGIKGMLIGKQLEYSGATLPFVHAAGNHENDPYIQPVNSVYQGTKTGEFSGTDNERFFGMRSSLIPMGSFLLAKNDFVGHPKNSYWGDDTLRDAMIAEWNAKAPGYSYRVMLEHTQTSGNGRSVFQNVTNKPRPTLLPNMELKGHDHFFGVNSYDYRVLSLGGGSWAPGSGALMQFNYNNGKWSSPAETSFTTNDRISLVASFTGGSPPTGTTKIRTTYTSNNNGATTSNSCTITNDVNFNFYDGRVRFVMAKGNYKLTGGAKLSQYDSADGTKTIVLAKVNIPASSSATVSIQADTIPVGEARTVSFNTQGGLMVADKIVRAGDTIDIATTPIKEGYIFVGWFDQATGGTKITFPYTVTNDITLYAHWTVKYTVNFDSGGGSAVASLTVDSGTALPSPAAPTKSNYTFKGWFTAASGGAKVTFPYSVTGNATLYAHWAILQGINMLNNGNFETSTGVSNSSNGENSSNYISGLYAATSTTDSKYLKWFRVGDGNLDYHDSIQPETGNTSNHVGKVAQTLLQGGLALNNGKTYTITFRAKAGAVTGTPIAQQHVEVAFYDATSNITSGTASAIAFNTDSVVSSVVNSSNQPAAGGVTISGAAPNNTLNAPLYLDGWYTYSLQFTLADNAITAGHSYGIVFRDESSYPSSWYYMYIDDVVLTEGGAQTATYNVNFDSQGGSTIGTQTVDDGTAITEPAAPTKSAFTFDGWYTAASGGTKVTFPYTPTGNVTLFANWVAAATCTVSFDSAGGSAVASQIVNSGSTASAPVNPTKTGFTFDGWYTAETGGTKVNFPYYVSVNVTLYAHWSVFVATNTVTFDSVGGSTVDPKTVANGTIISTPAAPTKSGYAFNGWYTAATGGVRITFPYNVIADVTLYAHWTSTATSLLQNGNFETPTGVSDSDKGETTSNYISGCYAATPVTDSKFLKWFRVGDGNKDYHDSIQPEDGNATNHVGKIAQTLLQGGLVLGNGKSYQITFRAKAGAVSGDSLVPHVSVGLYDATTSVAAGVSTALALKTDSIVATVVDSANKPAAGGITTVGSAPNNYLLAPLYQDGWYTYTIKFTLADNAITDGHSYGIVFSSDSTYSTSWYYMYIDDIAMAEQGQVANYTATFDSGDGSVIDPQTVSAGTVISAPADPTKADCTFNGWYTAASGGDKVTFPYTVNGDVTLYAHWTSTGHTPGDINNDGIVDLVDITILSRYVAGWTGLNYNEDALNVNGDSDVDLLDITMLSRFVAGWSVTIY